MNKYQEALGVVKHLTYKGEAWKDNPYSTKDVDGAIELLKELVDRATPMKPIKHVYEEESFNEEVRTRVYYKCSCETLRIVNREDNFCSNCGKALDWSKDE